MSAYDLRVGRPPSHLAWLGIAIAISGCVNNYVVGDDGSTSMAPATDESASEVAATGAGDDDGGTVCNDPVCPDPPATSTTTGDGGDGVEADGGSGGGDTGLPAMGRAPCDPCETDLHCGGEFDACVDLGGPSPVCTERCFEQPPCGRGATCQAVQSIEGQAGDQCVPTAGCPEPDPTGGSGAM